MAALAAGPHRGGHVGCAAGRRRGPRRLSVLLLAVVVAAATAGCGQDTGPSPRAGEHARDPVPGATASAGGLRLSQGRVLQPASPQVAAAYFTLANTGDHPARLVAARSPAARSVAPMDEVAHGGVMQMTTVDSLRVPAHGQVVFRPGARHLMLQGLRRHLEVGDRVPLSLRFSTGATVRVRLPVVPLTAGQATATDGRGHGQDRGDDQDMHDMHDTDQMPGM